MLTTITYVGGVKVGMAERFRARRQELGLTQDEAAAAIGVSTNTVQKIEKGSQKGMRSYNALAAAKVLKVSVEWLLDGEGSGPQTSAVDELVDKLYADAPEMPKDQQREFLTNFLSLPPEKRDGYLHDLKDLSDRKAGKKQRTVKRVATNGTLH